MSILLTVAPPTPLPHTTTHPPTSMPTDVAASVLLIWVAWAIVGLVVARLLGAFGLRSVLGPMRLSPDASGFDLLVILCAALGMEIAGAVLIMHHTDMAQAMKELIAGMVGKILSILVILLLLRFLKVLDLRAVGLSMNRLGIGLAAGAAALFILFPLVQLTSDLTIFVYGRRHFKMPDPHPVLQTMGENHNLWITIVGFVLAAIIAPIGEELFFRGVLQTALARFFAWIAYQLSPGGLVDKAPFLSVDSPRIGSRWAAIVSTATIFAVFHVEPAYMPALFLLAVGLGYAYERTGNLWVTITAHSLFNTAQILLYLALK